MTDVLAVVLLDGDAYAPLLAETLDAPVFAATPDTLEHRVATAADTAAHVVGLSAWPWLGHEDQHLALSTTYAGYRGVGSWYGLPQLATFLADVLAPTVSANTHVLFTAPDPGPLASAETLAFLPRLADNVSQRARPVGRSIAWQGQSRQPSTTQALDALVDAHGVTRIVECPVIPAVPGDMQLRDHAAKRQVFYTAVDVGVASRVDILATVIRTVAHTEWGDLS